MDTQTIQLNTLPGLESLPDEVVYEESMPGHPNVPEKDPDYVFRIDDVRVIYGFLNHDGSEGLLFKGPTGSGKSSVIWQMHAYLGRPLFYINGSVDLEYTDLVGTKEVIEGNTMTLDGPLVRAAGTPHASFLFEEMDRAPAEVSVALNPLLDGYGISSVLDQQVYTTEHGFKLIATANTGGGGDITGDYNTANILDKSFLDRFWTHDVWYSGEDIEFKILRKRVSPSIEDEHIRQSIRLANDIRYLYTGKDESASSSAQSFAGHIDATFSTRTLASFWSVMELFQVDKPVEYALNLVIANQCSDPCKEAIQQIAEAHFSGF
ncbi:MAG: AAA domain-containing protein [Pseudomonadales bacterium]|nr:AAA domain-containing protein [Pseudomonadales bacterium]